MAKPFLHLDDSYLDLPSERVKNLLLLEKDECMCYLPPISPKGGEVYLYSAEEKTKKGK